MITGQAIVEKAREYIGTPWHHCGRVKGVGVDCAGLLVCVFTELGAKIDAPEHYSMDDELETLLEAVEAECDKVQDLIRAGDIIVFRNTRAPGASRMYNHCGIYSGDGNFIHAWATASIHKVVEHPFDVFWSGSVLCVYRYKGVC